MRPDNGFPVRNHSQAITEGESKLSMSRSRKVLILASAVVIVIIIVVIALRLNTGKPKIPMAEAASKIKQVQVTEVIRGEIRDVLELSGSIEPNSQVTVFPEIAGIITAMSVDEADRVKKGQTLAVIEHEKLKLQMSQAEAAYQSAQTAYQQAEKLARIRVESQVAQAKAQLMAAESAHQQVLDLAETRTTSQIVQAESALASLQANLEKIIRGAREEDRKQGQAAVDQAKANLANAESNYTRMRKLFESGAISSQSFEQAQTQLDVAQAQCDTAVQQMALIEKGAREEDIEAMKAQVKQAEAAFELAQAQAETKTWEKDIALAESRVEAASADLKSAEALEAARSWEAEITYAKTTASQARAALDLAKRMVADATITAPITGVVSRRYLDQGGKASPAAPIFEIVDVGKVKAVVSVLESDLSRLSLGDEARVNIDTLTEPVPGEVSLISPILEPAKRSAKVEITVDNSKMDLRSGMFAKVEILVEVRGDAILIPRSAVLEDSPTDTGTVFVVQNGISERRQVKPGLSQESAVEITGGLNEGELVVTAGQHSLQDGEKVTVVKP